MHNHEPKGYKCPFCILAKGIEDKKILSRQSDVFYRDKYLTAFICAESWTNNPAHVLIITNKHYENLYDMPKIALHKVSELQKEVAIALKKVYKCDAVSLKQQNEPDGGQTVWHYHIHVFPRYKGDNIDHTEYKLVDPKLRKKYADRLRRYFALVPLSRGVPR